MQEDGKVEILSYSYYTHFYFQIRHTNFTHQNDFVLISTTSQKDDVIWALSGYDFLKSGDPALQSGGDGV